MRQGSFKHNYKVFVFIHIQKKRRVNLLFKLSSILFSRITFNYRLFWLRGATLSKLLNYVSITGKKLSKTSCMLPADGKMESSAMAVKK